MKTTNKILLAFFILVLAGITILMAYARINVIKPGLITESGNIVTKQFDIQDFRKIEVAGNIRVILQEGAIPAMTVTADENFVELMNAESSKDLLKINIHRTTRRQKPIEVELIYSGLDAINSSGGARVISRDTIVSDKFEISLMAGSNCDIKIIADELTVKAMAGVQAGISGRADRFDAESTAGSEINANGLQARMANLRATAGASISVHVTEEINATANSGASIRYSGEARANNISTSSGGSVTKH